MTTVFSKEVIVVEVTDGVLFGGGGGDGLSDIVFRLDHNWKPVTITLIINPQP
jgi:hypothetical protein